MQHRTHAAQGALTLATPWHRHVRDALQSIELVGTPTMSTTGGARQVIPAAAPDPIAAARTWLADPARRARLTDGVLQRADASVTLADAHVQRINEMCVELAEQFQATEVTNTELMGEVDLMLDALRRYSECMRALLDPEQPAADAEQRLDAALGAARHGGLTAFVAAL